MADQVLNQILRICQRVLTRSLRRTLRRASRPGRPTAARRSQQLRSGDAAGRSYPGDYRGCPQILYEPFDDDVADPGEIVWTWVPFEEDHSQGKDRPALIIGRDHHWLLALQVSSQSHDRDFEASQNRHWVGIGTGEWDSQRRPSDVRVDRVIRIDPGQVRRIGSVLSRDRFNEVARQVERHC